VGLAGFGGSAFAFTSRPRLPPSRRAGVSANSRPPGNSMPRSCAMRAANCRPTISSTVLEALLTSMPWSRRNWSMTS
jgi:hypothetical protein